MRPSMAFRGLEPAQTTFQSKQHMRLTAFKMQEGNFVQQAQLQWRSKKPAKRINTQPCLFPNTKQPHLQERRRFFTEISPKKDVGSKDWPQRLGIKAQNFQEETLIVNLFKQLEEAKYKFRNMTEVSEQYVENSLTRLAIKNSYKRRQKEDSNYKAMNSRSYNLRRLSNQSIIKHRDVREETQHAKGSRRQQLKLRMKMLSMSTPTAQ